MYVCLLNVRKYVRIYDVKCAVQQAHKATEPNSCLQPSTYEVHIGGTVCLVGHFNSFQQKNEQVTGICCVRFEVLTAVLRRLKSSGIWRRGVRACLLHLRSKDQSHM
jgi:hypothetical protein